MFWRSRAELEQLEGIRTGVERLVVAIQTALKAVGDDPKLTHRVEGLELSRAKWEAEMDAVVLKADSTLKSANNAEARARTMERHVEKFIDAEPPDRAEALAPEEIPLYGGDDYPFEAEEVQPLRLGLETTPKNERLRSKYS